jgi:hypothetical protein
MVRRSQAAAEPQFIAGAGRRAGAADVIFNHPLGFFFPVIT